MHYHFFAYMARLKHIRRWNMRRNSFEEDVAQHSLQVSMIAYALAAYRNARFGGGANPDRAAALATFEEQLAEIDAICPRLSHLHVFCWGPGNERFPLADGVEKWKTYFAHAAKAPGERAAILEFVLNDSPEQFLADAATLKEMLQ
mgnify:CR=1 FL=1